MDWPQMPSVSSYPVTVYQTDPIHDPRWRVLLARHPRTSIFHTPEWLEALRRTYGYEPVVVTTTGPDEDLGNGLVYCRIRSWLTGLRAVSLPFSDHCDPLVETEDEFRSLFSALKREVDEGKARYLEIRPVTLPGGVPAYGESSDSFYLHQLDLRSNLEEIFKGFHKTCVQRKIQRAERERLSYEEGNSESLLVRFYRLLILTRRRHQLPPQPVAWFRNLIACMGDNLKIRIASKDSQPVASILTLRCKDTMVYKYGCSDAQFHNLGGMHLLFWRSIQEAKEAGLRVFDLGRTECRDRGLIAFKDRWGAQRSALTYIRAFASGMPSRTATPGRLGWMERTTKVVFPHLPDCVLRATGSLLYRHMG